MRAASAICAICASNIVGAPRREPLGKNDAMVDVCDDCATEAPQEPRGLDRGYQVRDLTPVTAKIVKKRRRSLRRGARGRRFRGEPRQPLHAGESPRPLHARELKRTRAMPGFIVVRVARFVDGRSIDKVEAQESLRDQPWFADLEALGTTAKWHLFQRPDPDLVAKSRRELNGTDLDPIAWLTKAGQK